MSQEDKVAKNPHLQWIEDSLEKISSGVWCGAIALWCIVIIILMGILF